MTGLTTRTSPPRRKPSAADITRCILVTTASGPAAWLCASLLSHRTLGSHEQIGKIVLTVLLLGNAVRYSIRSWAWSGIFLSGLLLFPAVLDRRCLLLASLAIPMLTAVALDRWVAWHRVFVVAMSLASGVLAVLIASALLARWPGSVDQLLVNAWDVQWSMWGEQEQLSRTRGAWERAIGSPTVKELETRGKRELEAIKATAQEARQNEQGDYFQEAIGLYRRATEQLRQAELLMAALAQARLTWERALSAADGMELAEHAKRELEAIRTTAQEARQKEHGDYLQEAISLYRRATEQLEQLLLAEARANDSKENGMAALAVLAELLKLAPDHAEAKALQAKIAGYFTATNTIGMKFAVILPGTFMMGSLAGEQARSSDETQHPVTLTKAFCMQTTPVTQAQWKAVMVIDPSNFKGDDLPVESVSWNDAINFCRRLSEKEGKHYRLPTEAEWEYACRAGTTTRFYTGDDDQSLDRAGWYSENSGNETHPVGQKQPNAFGLYDMHGNVWQWCSDVYDSNYPAGPVSDPAGPAQNPNASRVLRGGSWYGLTVFCRSAYRLRLAPDDRSNSIGFRVVLDSP